MSQVPDKYRRINIGFKPQGVDPEQDMAYDILQAFDKKGTKARLIARALSEYLAAHGVIGGERLGKVLILSPPNESSKASDEDVNSISRPITIAKPKKAALSPPVAETSPPIPPPILDKETAFPPPVTEKSLPILEAKTILSQPIIQDNNQEPEDELLGTLLDQFLF